MTLDSFNIDSRSERTSNPFKSSKLLTAGVLINPNTNKTFSIRHTLKFVCLRVSVHARVRVRVHAHVRVRVHAVSININVCLSWRITFLVLRGEGCVRKHETVPFCFKLD